MITMTEREFYVRYRIRKEEILQNRRAYHYFRVYVMGHQNAEILGKGYREMGKRGIVQIARWLGVDSDIVLAAARRQARIAEKEAM